MSRTRTKRIVWTMAVLLALAFVAAMVLHKHEEPIIIGNLSKEDISEISKGISTVQRDYFKVEVETRLKHGEIIELWHSTTNYLRNHIVSISGNTNGVIVVEMGFGTNKNSEKWTLLKQSWGWKALSTPMD